MFDIETVLFVLVLVLLFVHEMDAVRRKEWKMLPVLKNMDDEQAYRMFALLHIPLYAFILLLLASDFSRSGVYVLDVFMIAHTAIHWLMRKHHANDLNNRISKGVIYSAGLLAIVHVIMISIQ